MNSSAGLFVLLILLAVCCAVIAGILGFFWLMATQHVNPFGARVKVLIDCNTIEIFATPNLLLLLGAADSKNFAVIGTAVGLLALVLILQPLSSLSWTNLVYRKMALQVLKIGLARVSIALLGLLVIVTLQNTDLASQNSLLIGFSLILVCLIIVTIVSLFLLDDVQSKLKTQL